MRKLGIFLLFLCFVSQIFAGPFGFAEIGEEFIFDGDYSAVDDIDAELGGYKKYRFSFSEPINIYFRNCYVVVDADGILVDISAVADIDDRKAFDLLLEASEARYGKPQHLEKNSDKNFFVAFFAALFAAFTNDPFSLAEWTFRDGLGIKLEQKLVFRLEQKFELSIEYSSQQYRDYLQYELPTLKTQYELSRQNTINNGMAL